MTRKTHFIFKVLSLLLAAILLFELIRDSMHPGDFVGYVDAGNLVLSGQYIYSDIHNTWPPFFSVFSVLLAAGDTLSSVMIRFLWLSGSILSFYFIVALSVKMVFYRPLVLKIGQPGVKIQDPLIIIPLMIILRFLLDNLTAVQINIYMLLCTLLCLKYFIRGNHLWAGFFLGLTISLKIYTLFFLLYFIYKREFKPVAWTCLFLVVFNLIPFLVFGVDQTVEYYHHWISVIFSESFKAEHMNQSVFGAFLRFFTTEDPHQNLYVNILAVDAHCIKRVTYAVIGLASIYPAYLLRKRLVIKDNFSSLLEYGIIFTMIPMLSPVAWKAFFIFLWFPYFLSFIALFGMETGIRKRVITLFRSLFFLSVILNIFSTELIVGRYFSDVLEAYSAITIGTFLLLVIQIFIVIHAKQFDLSADDLRSVHEKKKIL